MGSHYLLNDLAFILIKSCYLYQAYEDYSFEELRWMSPMKRRTSETMLVRPNADGSFSANWTPSASGRYTIYVTIDGYPLEEIYEVLEL